MDGLHVIKGVFVLDNEGKRLFSKYYSDLKNKLDIQKSLESNLFQKSTKSSQIDILLSDKYSACVKSISDLFIYVVGGKEDNEIILSNVLETLTDALDTLFGGQLERRTLLENLELIILCVDEILEDGYIMELDSSNVSSRVSNSGDSLGPDKKKDIFSQLLGSASEQIKNSLFSFGSN